MQMREMKIIGRVVLVLALFLMEHSSVAACTVFFAFDGKLALAGNNEDWADPNTQMWFVPATKDNYGIVYFGFGRGEYPKGGISHQKLDIPGGDITKVRPDDLYGLPQGGMNDKGLFFDMASTEAVKVLPAPNKKVYDGRLEDHIMRKCATVEEALKLLDQYAFTVSQGQCLFADKSGDSFILEAGGVIIRKRVSFQAMTNFRQSQVAPDQVTCPRYKLVSESLTERKDVSIEQFRSLLKGTAQEFTTYSTIFNLGEGEVHIYRQRDFEQVVKINLKEELTKGERAVKISSLFDK